MLLHWTKIGVEIFSLHTFFAQCSLMLIEQLINLRKLKNENLKIETDLQN